MGEVAKRSDETGWKPCPTTAPSPRLTVSPSPGNVHVLTDAPEVVRLKREFRVLDELDQNLKAQAAHTQERLIVARARKAEIALEIFGEVRGKSVGSPES